MSGNICAEEVYSSNVLEKPRAGLRSMQNLWRNPPELQLCGFSNMNMIDILRKFIRAEHTGNCELYLATVYPSHASIHGSFWLQLLHQIWHAVLILQHMSNILTQHPDVQQHFSEGLHLIQKSNRLWAGLSSDLVIEQVLMRSLKEVSHNRMTEN